jgi:serine protease
MRQILKTLMILMVVLFCISDAALGGAPKGTRITKHLPLDGVPEVVMKNRSNSEYLPGVVVVKLMPQATTGLSKSSFGVASIDRVLSRVMGVSTAQLFPTATAKKTGEVDLSQLFAVHYSSPNDPFTISEELSQLPEVQYAEPWFISRISKDGASTPNDPYFLGGAQWGLSKINALNAWNYTEGDSTVVIAIVDVGVAWNHPDLAANIWVNPGESGVDATGDKRSNGKDDDGNGYVDDWHGWDFVGASYQAYNPLTTKGDNDPAPTNYFGAHGTHVAGIAAAVTNNGIGVASLAHKCKIMPVKAAADDDPNQYVLAGYQGIVYAATMGAKVINCSWGAPGGSQSEQDIIDFATQRGALVVAAAGNDTSDRFQSPASYRNVLSVAATDQSDKRSVFSNYGDYVDVCAPGEFILSTVVFPTGYEYWAGTSMASPLAASLAALVRSTKPNFTAIQAGEQVRVTCDNIDAANPAFAGRLGRGRINALRAVTEFTNPSVRLQSYVVNDFPGGNGNGMPQPAETLNVVCQYRNYLSRTSAGATVQLTTDSPYLTIIRGAFSIPSLGTLDSVTNASSPFRVFVKPNVPQSATVRLRLTFTDGSSSDVQYISFLVNPTFATQNVNAIQLTLTNNGRLGFYDFPDNKLGVGFIFNGVNHLFEGGLIIGRSATQVVDVVRDPTGVQDGDFISRNFYTLQTPGVVSDQDGLTMFTDSAAAPANQIGLQVKMHSYAYSDPSDSKYVIIQYDLANTTTSVLTNVYAGVFLDWDLGTVTANYSKYDSSRSLGYAYDGDPVGTRVYAGIRALDSAASFRSLVNNTSIVLSREGKWDWISNGFLSADAGPADIHHVISSGPFTINPGATKKVGFALVAGDSSLANIQKNADAAKAKWIAINKVVGIMDNPGSIPLTSSLSQNYPNPFNPSTSFKFQVSSFGLVTLRIYDVLGREISTLVNEMRPAGVYTIRWDASLLPSGVYFYRLRAGDFVGTKKMVFAK